MLHVRVCASALHAVCDHVRGGSVDMSSVVGKILEQQLLRCRAAIYNILTGRAGLHWLDNTSHSALYSCVRTLHIIRLC